MTRFPPFFASLALALAVPALADILPHPPARMLLTRTDYLAVDCGPVKALDVISLFLAGPTSRRYSPGLRPQRVEGAVLESWTIDEVSFFGRNGFNYRLRARPAGGAPAYVGSYEDTRDGRTVRLSIPAPVSNGQGENQTIRVRLDNGESLTGRLALPLELNCRVINYIPFFG